jgi:hypothetical protein
MTDVNKFLFILIILVLPLLASSAERVRIAVAPVAYSAAGRYAFDDRLAVSISDKLNVALAALGRFDVVERVRLGSTLREQTFSFSGAIDPATAARVGLLLGAKTVVVSEINQYDCEYNGKAESYSVKISFGIKFVDAETGVIAKAAQFETWGSGSSSQSATFNAATSVVSRAMTEVCLLYPMNSGVVKVDGKTVYIGSGSTAGVKTDMRFRIVRSGEALLDPATGEYLGAERIDIGTIKTVSVEERFSKGVVVKNKMEIRPGDEVVETPAPGSRFGLLAAYFGAAGTGSVNDRTAPIYYYANKNFDRDTSQYTFGNPGYTGFFHGFTLGVEGTSIGGTGMGSKLCLDIGISDAVSLLMVELDLFYDIPLVSDKLWIPLGGGIGLGSLWYGLSYTKELESMNRRIPVTAATAEGSVSSFQMGLNAYSGLRFRIFKGVHLFADAGFRYHPVSGTWKISYKTGEKDKDGNDVNDRFDVDERYLKYEGLGIHGFFCRAGVSMGW